MILNCYSYLPIRTTESFYQSQKKFKGKIALLAWHMDEAALKN